MSKIDEELKKINIKISQLVEEKKLLESNYKKRDDIHPYDESDIYLYGESGLNEEGAPII